MKVAASRSDIKKLIASLETIKLTLAERARRLAETAEAMASGQVALQRLEDESRRKP